MRSILPFRVASITPRIVVLIRWHILVVILQFILVIVAVKTIVYRKIAGCRMALAALVPLIVMLPAIDWKVHIVMVKRRWLPSILGMAGGTIRREARRLVVRVVRPGVFRLVTAVASVRRIVVVPIVASGTIILDSHVRTLEGPKLAVNREGRRIPIR